jgi:hypothetical protein
VTPFDWLVAVIVAAFVLSAAVMVWLQAHQ